MEITAGVDDPVEMGGLVLGLVQGRAVGRSAAAIARTTTTKGGDR